MIGRYIDVPRNSAIMLHSNVPDVLDSTYLFGCRPITMLPRRGEEGDKLKSM
jgi:hypothetical protein